MKVNVVAFHRMMEFICRRLPLGRRNTTFCLISQLHSVNYFSALGIARRSANCTDYVQNVFL